MAHNQTFTVAAIYCTNEQRFTGQVDAENVTAAVIAILKEARSSTDDEIAIFGVFVGRHNAQDSNMKYAYDVPQVSAQFSATKNPFTVVTDEQVVHVMAADWASAELAVNPNEDNGVASVFAGHLTDIYKSVDWPNVMAVTGHVTEEAEA